MRPIKELMQIMLDNVGEISKHITTPSGLCDLSSFLEEKKLITDEEEKEIDSFLEPIIDKFKRERNSIFYAFEPGLVEPRRELLIKIISNLP